MNDVASAFYLLFTVHQLSMHQQPLNDSLLKSLRSEFVTPNDFTCIETDTYWCMSKLIDGIQENYTFAQPGIQKMVFKLQEIVGRIDVALTKHLQFHNVQFIHFAFRWMNCLLMREMSLPLILRLWDCYLSEDHGNGFKHFHVYVCAAFLMKWTDKLKSMEFQDLVLFLQHLPTEKWDEKDVETLLAQAYVYKSWFHSSYHINS